MGTVSGEEEEEEKNREKAGGGVCVEKKTETAGAFVFFVPPTAYLIHLSPPSIRIFARLIINVVVVSIVLRTRMV